MIQTLESSLENIREHALKLGAVEAKIIPVEKIVIEERLVLKCSLGCEKYGKTLACPPHSPTPEKFRRIVNEYHYALFMKFRTGATIEPEYRKYLAKTPDSTVSEGVRAKVAAFWDAWKNEANKLLATVIELEKVAAKEGFILAAGFVSGACTICGKCNVEKGVCLHPEKRRFSEEGMGLNVKATAEKAGIKFTFPFEEYPETYATLLID